MAFIRKYKITFGVSRRTVTNYVNYVQPPNTRVVPDNAKTLTGGFDDNNQGLQIELTATYKKSGGKKPDGTVLKIYNMHPDDRAVIEQKNAVVVIHAGYQDDDDELPIIYQGEVKKVVTDQLNQHIVTTVYLEDGYLAKTSAKVSKHYPEGTPVKAVFYDLIDTLPDVSRGSIVLDNLNDISALQSGLSLFGSSSQMIDQLCKAYNLNWNITHGVVNIHDKILYKGTIQYNRLLPKAFKVTPQLIKGSVQRMRDNNKKKPSANLDRTGLKLNLFLNGRIKAGNLIKVEEFAPETNLNGIYEVQSVTHRLDYRGKEWTTSVETSKLGG